MGSPFTIFPSIRTQTILLLVFFFGLPETTFAKKNSIEPRLKITNLCDSATIVINNKKTSPDSLGNYLISKGLNTIQIERNGSVRYSTSLVFNDNLVHTLRLDCSEGCASLDIVTEPFGASVEVNGSYVGMTPYFNGFMKSGEHSLTVTHMGYKTINDNIFISQDKPSMFTLTMETSPVYQDSMHAIKYARKRSRQFVQKVLFGSLAAVLAGTAIYFDADARHKLSLADQNANGYNQARSNFSNYRSDYYDNRNSARQALGARDVLYYGVTACFFGVSFSFLF